MPSTRLRGTEASQRSFHAGAATRWWADLKSGFTPRYAGIVDDPQETQAEAFPYPPRCRGIVLSDGTYAGCPYGSGELRPLTGPCDCPICNDSGYEGMIATWDPHQNFGDSECCGFLFGLVRNGEGYIGCNDCPVIVRKVPADRLRQVLNEMESELELASEQCPHCGKVNLFPGFSTMMTYTCHECGRLVRLSEDPGIETDIQRSHAERRGRNPYRKANRQTSCK